MNHSLRVTVVLTLSLAGLGCLGPTHPPAPAPTREGRWRQDLHYLAENLPRLHKNLFFKTNREKWEWTVRSLDQALPGLQDHEIVVGLMRLVARVGDAHTALSWPFKRTYPLGLYWFNDGIYVLQTTRPYEQALRCRLVRIGPADVGEVCAAVRELISHENDISFRSAAPRFLEVPEILEALGYVADMEQALFTFADSSGQQFTLELSPLREDPEARPEWVGALSSAGVPKPVYLTNSADYWFQYLEDSRTLYCQYNSCRNSPGKPFAGFAKEVFAFADSHRVDRFVLDLRLNGGGDSQIAGPLIRGLAQREQINRKGHLFVLIGRDTFSSAMLNAVELRRRTRAVFIGEPTGQKPNSYGELRTFKLPNSGITVSYSTKYFRVLDDDPPSFIPDVSINVRSADYFAGHDPALEAALRYAGP